MKEKAYKIVLNIGMKMMSAIFPDYFSREALKPSNRYIEYPFAFRNLPKPPAKILDVGCVSSFFSLLLAGAGYETWGIDIRKYDIIKKIKFDNFKFSQGSIKKTDFPGDFFDAVTAISTLEHIGLSGRYGDKEDLSADKKAMNEMVRVIKPAGILLLTIPFGVPKIVRPHCKIYNFSSVQQLIEGLPVEIEKEEYYMVDSQGDWFKSSQEEAQVIDIKSIDVDLSPLCLLKIVKK